MSTLEVFAYTLGHSSTYKLKATTSKYWRLVCKMQLIYSRFVWECLNMDDGSSSCVKVLYSACDSVLSTKWLIQIGTEVLKWS